MVVFVQKACFFGFWFFPFFFIFWFFFLVVRLQHNASSSSNKICLWKRLHHLIINLLMQVTPYRITSSN